MNDREIWEQFDREQAKSKGTIVTVTGCSDCPMYKNEHLYICKADGHWNQAGKTVLFESCPLKQQPIIIKLEEDGKH